MVVDCSGWIEPLNLQCLFVNILSGSIEVFMFISFIFIAGLGAYFRMLNATVLIMFGLFAIFMAKYIGGIYFLAILLVGLIVSYAIGKIVKM